MATRQAVAGSGIYIGHTDGADGYADNSDGINQDLLRTAQVVNPRVISRITAATLAGLSPTQGQVYIVTDGGDATKIHTWDDGAWFKVTPLKGWIRFDANTDDFIWFDGTAWSVGLPAVVSGVDLADLDDVDLTGLSTNDFLMWDGTNWVPGLPTGTLPTIAGGDAYKYLRVKSDESGYELTHLIEAHPYAFTDEATAATTGTAKITFRMPYAFHVTAVRLSANTAGTAIQVDINEAGVSILSTKLTLDSGEKTSTSAATPAVISDASIADDAEMTIDIDSLTGTWKGLKAIIYGYRT